MRICAAVTPLSDMIFPPSDARDTRQCTRRAAPGAAAQLTGKEHLSFYHPIMYDDDGKDVGVRSPGERAFCKLCGTQLWNWDPRWPALLHPTAGVIDSELPKPPKMIDFMTKFTPGWVHMPETDGNFERYPDVDLGSFHKKYAKELGAGAGAGAAAGADA